MSRATRNGKPRKGKHLHNRFTDRNGRTWVTRSVDHYRRIPGWFAVDPLTLPFLRRPSTLRNAARMLADAWSELGTAEWNATDDLTIREAERRYSAVWELNQTIREAHGLSRR